MTEPLPPCLPASNRSGPLHARRSEAEDPSAASTPFVSATSSPARNGGMPNCYFSAPTSPTRGCRSREAAVHSAAALFSWNDQPGTSYGVPFSWEDKPGIPTRKSEASDLDGQSPQSLTGSDFEFSARFVELQEPPMSPTPMSSANELFLNGQIRALGAAAPVLQQPFPSGRQLVDADVYSFDSRSCVSCPVSLPQSPRSMKNDERGSVMSSNSDRRPETFDFFSMHVKEPRKTSTDNCHRRVQSLSPVITIDENASRSINLSEKGISTRTSDPRLQTYDSFSMAVQQMRKNTTDNRHDNHHRLNRSLSPFRIFNSSDETTASKSLCPPTGKAEKNVHNRSSPSSSRKWTLKGLLHRSGGDAKAQSLDNRRWQYASSSQSSRGSRRSESSHSSVDWEKSGARSSVDYQGSSKSKANPKGIKSSSRPPKGSMSPHELHYTKQRAQTEELKRKTFLPYRQGLLGCLGLSSKSYRAVTRFSNTLQPVS